MEGVRAIVCADQVLVLGAPLADRPHACAGVPGGGHPAGPTNPASLLLPSPSKHPHAALAASPFVLDLCARIKEDRAGSGGGGGGGEGSGGQGGGGEGKAPTPADPPTPATPTPPPPSASAAPLPYELRATEAVLLTAVRRLDGEVGALEGEAGPDLDRLLGGALGRDDLLRLRAHKAALGRLLARAAGLRGALESLLDDDTDLANLYLGRRAARAAALAAAAAAAERVEEEEEEEEQGEGEGEQEKEGGGGGAAAEADAGRRGSKPGSGRPASLAEAATPGEAAAPAAAAAPPLPALLPRTETGTGRRATLGTARGTDCGSEAGTAIAIWARGVGGGAWFGNAAARGGGGSPPGGGGHHPTLLEECEGAANLLDAYATLAGGTLARLEGLRDRVASSEALVRLELDRRRNELVAFNMVCGGPARERKNGEREREEKTR